ncbi:MAG: ComF family protein [Candidatus Staskawiczbacteria bacterium]|nr:ComF family protein [Candidatus Staskawiczbacteria bacterium]
MNDLDHKFQKSKKFVLDLFFPRFCLGCQKEGIYLCDDCRTLLDISEYDYCLCDKPVRLLPDLKISLPGKCNRCQDKRLSGLYFALPYKEKTLTRKLIYQFKYQPYLKDLSKTLASILIEHFVLSKKNTDEIWENSLLIPVPLDKKKLKIRGYNQSEELAKELSKVLQIPVIPDVLIKTKHTKPQMELKKEQREKNLQGAFQINPVRNSPPAGEISNGVKNPSPIFGKKVFLIDDVYTTGSTMQECAKVLRQAGAKQVWGIVIAREN